MIELWGIPFEDDEVQVDYIDGEPEWTVNRKGARRMAEHAPNREAAAQFLAYLDTLPAEPEGR